MKLLRTFCILALVLPGLSVAQYVATLQAGVSYPALTNATPVQLTAPGMNDPKDKGRAAIPLGFTFPFYSRTYTAITVTANGLLFLEPSSGANSEADFPANAVLPSSGEPNGIIAPLWDDLIGDNPNSALQTQPVTGANGQGLAIEFRDWNRVFGAFSLTFQVRLWENGIVEFFYGTMTGSGATVLSATIGIESGSGTAATRGLVGCTNDCGLSSFDPNGTGTPISAIRFGPPTGVDLQAVALTVDGITQAGDTLSIASTLQLRNFGTQASGPFTYELYLSEDTQVDGSDLPLTPQPPGPYSLGPLVATVASHTGDVQRPDGGSWYLLASIPVLPGGETNPFNNVVASSVPYAAGVDLVAEAVTPPPIAGPGDPLAIDVAFSNQGFESAGAVTVRLWGSVDTSLSSDDVLLDDQPLTVVGGQQVHQPLTFTLSALTPADDYYVILELDPGADGGVIAELNEANNQVVSAARMQVRQADLTVTEVRVLDAQAPHDPLGEVYLGETAQLEAHVSNVGGANANNVVLSFYLSDNQSLNGVTDTHIGNVTGQSFAPGESRWIVLPNAPIPAVDAQGHALAVGPYFVFAAATAIGTQETNPTNNFTDSSAIFLRAPAPNLLPVNLQSPSLGGAGELIPISSSFANLGNRDSPAAVVRYFLSANTIITADDFPLPIVTSGGDLTERSVTLTIGQRVTANEVLRLPQSLTGGTYYVGALIDPDGQIDETDESDNGLAGLPMTVAPVNLSLQNAVLPDAILGQPYAVQLLGRGGDGTYTFTALSLPAGLTLSAGGLLSGTPTAAGAFTLFATLTSGSRSVTVAIALRVGPVTASLGLDARPLPAPVRDVTYLAQLGVAGGVAPYTFSVIDGGLPVGLQLSRDGVLSGTPSSPQGTQSVFTVRVVDAIGNVDARAYVMTVVDPSPFTIQTRTLPDGQVGVAWAQAVVVINPDGAAIETPVTWSLSAGRLPPGLALESSTNDTVFLSGTPTQGGRFSFQLEAVDAQGRSDRVTYLVSIAAGAIELSVQGTSRVAPGDAVTITFTASPMPAGARWVLEQGRLAPGVSLDDAAGTLTGTVATDAAEALYTCVIGLEVDGTVLSVQPFTLEVSTDRQVASGCSSIDALGIGLVLVGLGRRRRVCSASR